MSSAIYTDPRLTAVYEALNTPGSDDAFYLDLAGAKSQSILDMGCGTGRLACDLAARGHAVTGAEPSTAMLDIARQRSGAQDVMWINSGATDLSIANRFDLIFMTGHVFQVFLRDDEISTALRVLRDHLAPHGRLAFETRNPLVRKWEQWTAEKTTRHIEVTGIGTVQVHQETRSVAGPLVTYETHFRFPDGDVLVASDTLRFLNYDELATHLHDAGFNEVTWYGGWERSTFTPESPEIIAICSRAAELK